MMITVKAQQQQGKLPLSTKYSSGSQVAAILNPVRGLRDQQRRDGKEVVDHARRNVQALRETQRRVQEEREAKLLARPKEPFKIKKFQHVESKIRASARDEEIEDQDKPKHRFLRKGERCKESAPTRVDTTSSGYTPNSARSGTPDSQGTGRTRTILKQPVPKATDLNCLAPRSSKNFIQENTRDVLERDAENRAKTTAKKEQERLTANQKHSSFGQVPDYLIKRQAEILEEKNRHVVTDPDCPPGMVLVKEEERKKTLDSLRRNGEELRNDLRKFPLSLRSLAQREKKKEVEEKLEEIESAIELFSREKVYVYE